MPSRITSNTLTDVLRKLLGYRLCAKMGLLLLAGFVLMLFSGADGRTASQKKSPFGEVSSLGGPGSGAKRPLYVPGEMLVKFKSEASTSTIASLYGQLGAKELRSFSINKAHHLKLPEGMAVEEAVAQYRSNPAVEYAEPNYLVYAEAVPNDTSFGNLWGLHNTGQMVNGTPGTNDADIDAPEAWDITTGSSNVIIAVIDSGVAYDHPDLAPNMWTNPGEVPNDGIDNDNNGFIDDVRGWDFMMDDNDPMDLNGHGTHVSGTIAAKGNNASGITGVMWDAKIMAVRFLSASGSGTTADGVAAIQYAVAKGAKVINASYGSTGCSLSQYDAISAANNAGVLFVAAAGNDGTSNETTPHYPSNFSVATTCQGQQKAALPNVISVAATTSTDQLATFSNFGANAVQVAAPGTSIFSAKPTANTTAPIISENFDGSASLPVGWTTSGTNNTWGVTNTASFSPARSLTDSPAGNYVNNTNSIVKAPNFSTVGQRGCRADARIRYDLEFDSSTGEVFDFVLIDASSNGGQAFKNVGFIAGSSGGLFELLAPVDIPDGKTAATLRFNLQTDGSVTRDGVYIDDARVICTSGAPLATDLQFLDGTSMATPHVAGLAGLLLAANPNLTIAQLRDAILNTGDAKSALTGKVSTGKRINARAAVASVSGGGGQTFNVAVQKNGTGSGTVTSNPVGINCGTTCSAQFNQGTSVTLTATATSGSTFAGWNGGGCVGTGTCTVSATVTVTATFNVVGGVQTFNVDVNKAGTGSGTVTSNPAGINCGTTCSAQFNQGTSVTLTATAASGSTFAGWNGGGCGGTGTCTVSTTVTVTATFDATQPTDVSGTWSGTYTNSRQTTPASLTITVTQTGSTFTGNFSGTYTIQGGGTVSGTVSGSVNGSSILFGAVQTAPCAGSFNGTGTVAGNTMTLNYSGSDCDGSYSNAQATLAKQAPAPPSSGGGGGSENKGGCTLARTGDGDSLLAVIFLVSLAVFGWRAMRKRK